MNTAYPSLYISDPPIGAQIPYAAVDAWAGDVAADDEDGGADAAGALGGVEAVVAGYEGGVEEVEGGWGGSLEGCEGGAGEGKAEQGEDEGEGRREFHRFLRL